MTISDFYSKIFCRLANGQEVYLCISVSKDGSIYPEDGEGWFCAERQRLGGSNGEWYSILHVCGGCSPAAIVTDHPTETDAGEIADSISTCYGIGMDSEDIIYVERQLNDIIETRSGMEVIDEAVFGDTAAHKIDIEIHDGVAVGWGKDKGLMLVYPTLDRLTADDIKSILEYIGEPDKTYITPHDVCIKFGRLMRIN